MSEPFSDSGSMAQRASRHDVVNSNCQIVYKSHSIGLPNGRDFKGEALNRIQDAQGLV